MIAKLKCHVFESLKVRWIIGNRSKFFENWSKIQSLSMLVTGAEDEFWLKNLEMLVTDLFIDQLVINIQDVTSSRVCHQHLQNVSEEKLYYRELKIAVNIENSVWIQVISRKRWALTFLQLEINCSFINSLGFFESYRCSFDDKNGERIQTWVIWYQNNFQAAQHSLLYITKITQCNIFPFIPRYK